MLSFDPRTIRNMLRERDVALNPPVTVDALERLTRWAGEAPHPDVVEILREFDGFSDGDFDAESFVSIWPIDKAMANDWSKRPTLVFADWSLNAFNFRFDPVAGGPITNIDDTRPVAPNYRDFWSLLLSDRLL